MFNKEVDEVQNQAKEKIQQGKNAVEEGGKDWMEYVGSHPIQSLFFGIIGYFAFRGFVKD